MRTIMAVAFAAAITTSCTAGIDGNTAAPDPTNRVVEVQNNNWLDATVYAVSHGLRQRLGMVTTHQSRRFVLPRGMVRADGQIQLQVELIGSSTSYVTPPIMIGEGDMIDFAVENHLPLSNYMVMSFQR